MSAAVQHQFEDQWGRLCSAGLHILVGTGVEKALNGRVLHAFSQLTFLEQEIANDTSWTLLDRINERTGRKPGQPWNELEPAIAQLEDPDLRMLARDLTDFFLVTCAEERNSNRKPGGDDLVQELK